MFIVPEIASPNNGNRNVLNSIAKSPKALIFPKETTGRKLLSVGSTSEVTN